MGFADEVIHRLREALKITPQNASVHHHLADLLFQQQDWPGAEEAYKATLLLRPEEIMLKRKLAQVFVHLGKTSAALVLIEDILPSLPKDPELLFLCGRLLQGRGETAQAAHYFQQAIQYQPELAQQILQEGLMPPS